MTNYYPNDFTNTVKAYYKNLKKYQPLSLEEEKKLIALAQNNNLSARNKILTAHLKFVFNIAKKYKGHGVDMDDLIAEGNIGLAKALDKFDISKNVKFITYAVWWIRQAMQDSIKKRAKQHEYECSDEEELYEPIINERDVADEEDDCLTQIEIISSDEADELKKYHKRKNNLLINKLISKLDYREKYIITAYYGLESKAQTLDEIGESINLSKERVRQVKEKSLRKLRSEALVLS